MSQNIKLKVYQFIYLNSTNSGNSHIDFLEKYNLNLVYFNKVLF